MKRILVLVAIFCSCATTYSQQYITRNGIARFYSRTDLEDIAAENKQVMAILDAAKKQIAVSMLMKGFLFKKELMQDHFNEDYVESDRFPKAVFEGAYAEPLNASVDARISILLKGKLTMHGISREIEVPATLETKNGLIAGSAEFQVVPEDYGIKIPSLVRDKISRKVDVLIAFTLKQQ